MVACTFISMVLQLDKVSSSVCVDVCSFSKSVPLIGLRVILRCTTGEAMGVNGPGAATLHGCRGSSGAQTNQPTLGQLDHTLLFVNSNPSFIQRRRPSPKIHHATQDE